MPGRVVVFNAQKAYGEIPGERRAAKKMAESESRQIPTCRE
jgi:hypothetical protein